MTFTLDQVVPWGRSFEEYVRMFDLCASDLEKHILGCADGPASFNAELTGRGGRVVSCDPLYAFSTEEIRRRIEETFPLVLANTRANQSAYIWDTIKSPNHLGELRRAAMDLFLADFAGGTREGRYLQSALPTLDFPDNQFGLALCSHFLFLYSDHFSFEFHRAAALELARVAEEVRIFPLLDLAGRPSPHVAPLTAQLRAQGLTVKIQVVPYEFQRGGCYMMKILK